MLEEGWYLMDTHSLERELARYRRGSGPPGKNVVPLSIAEALEYRNRGNVPDELGRSLRLVLHIDNAEDLQRLDSKRFAYEPDYLDPPTWRREGSAPVNVVPLRGAEVEGRPGPWWEDEEMAALEAQWKETGSVDGVRIPEAYRSFLYKSVIALRAAGREVTVGSLSGAIERWLSPEQASEIRTALQEANPGSS
jgi:hypothetical protein